MCIFSYITLYCVNTKGVKGCVDFRKYSVTVLCLKMVINEPMSLHRQWYFLAGCGGSYNRNKCRATGFLMLQ